MFAKLVRVLSCPFSLFSLKKQGLLRAALLVAPEQRNAHRAVAGSLCFYHPYVVTIEPTTPAAFAIPIPISSSLEMEIPIENVSHLFTSNCSIAWKRGSEIAAIWKTDPKSPIDLSLPLRNLRFEHDGHAKYGKPFAVKVTRLDPKICWPRNITWQAFWANGQAPFNQGTISVLSKTDTEVLKIPQLTHVFKDFSIRFAIFASAYNYSATKLNPRLDIKYAPIEEPCEFSVFPAASQVGVVVPIEIVLPAWFIPDGTNWFAWYSENVFTHHGGTWQQRFPLPPVESLDGKTKTYSGTVICPGPGNFTLGLVSKRKGEQEKRSDQSKQVTCSVLKPFVQSKTICHFGANVPQVAAGVHTGVASSHTQRRFPTLRKLLRMKA
jgi:hypothetical protein